MKLDKKIVAVVVSVVLAGVGLYLGVDFKAMVCEAPPAVEAK